MNSILTVSKVYTLDLHAEIHCDMCGDVEHNHIDCPLCLEKNAPTNAYCDLFGEESFILKCEECESQFKLVGNSWYSDPRVIRINRNT